MAAVETAARANEILALDVDQLDLPRRRAIVIGKGGRAQLVGWETKTAGLLPRLRTATGGWTLHQLRHSRLTHLAEQGIQLPMLMLSAVEFWSPAGVIAPFVVVTRSPPFGCW